MSEPASVTVSESAGAPGGRVRNPSGGEGGVAHGGVSTAAPRRPTRRRSRVAVDELEWAITRVARTILRLGVPPQVLRPGERVDRAGYWVLVRLDEAPAPLRLSELAGALQLDLSTVSRQVRDLVTSGLVTRESDPGDGRAFLLGLSARGRAVLDGVRQARRAILLEALDEWGPAERVALAASLARLADDLRSTTAPGDAP